MSNHRPETNWLTSVFGTEQPLIGMVHLLPLPGSPSWGGNLDIVLKQAKTDASTLLESGFHGVLIENHGDSPFTNQRVAAITIAAMSLAIREVQKVTNLPLGINVLRNDALSALALAAVVKAQFIRINVLQGVVVAEEGVLEGQAYEVLRYRTFHCPEVKIFADVLVKHAVPLGSADIVLEAKATLHRAHADALVVSGAATGEPTHIEDVAKIRTALPNTPLFVGSGVSDADVKDLLSIANGIIVGTNLKEEALVDNPIDPQRARSIVDRAQ